MSIALLPDELVEIIFSFVRQKTAPPDQESHQTFASLALTSRRFVMLARSYLYFRPILQPFRHVTWEKAIALCSALSSRLGRLVNSLEGIVDFVSEVGTLVEPRTPLSFQLAREGREGYTEAFSLYYALLKACPKLVYAELIFNSSDHLAKLTEALDSSMSSLETLKFTNSRFSYGYRIDTDLLLVALDRIKFRKTPNLEVGDVYGSHRGGPPSIVIPVASISFFHGSYHTRLLPQDPSALKSCSVHGSYLTAEKLQWLFDYLPASITVVSVSESGDIADVELAEYMDDVYDAFVPAETFSRFACLSHLTLQGSDGPSLDPLKNLTSSAASLVRLDLTKSTWIPSPSARVSPSRSGSSITGLVDPHDLLDHLLKFEKLRSIELGILPTTSNDSYAIVKEELEQKRGIKVDWQLCR
ncbi:hypothetical protein JCM3766R1_000929 [Sporobolomyces carnicolor]